MNDAQPQNSNNDLSISRFPLLWIAAVLSISALNSHAANAEKQPLRAIEIAGISINTPPEIIAGILQAQGYTQINASLYTKQEQLQNGRNAIFRIEIEENPTFRQITYFRSLGGGRIKSPSARDAPVPDSDIDMAQQLHQFVCASNSEEIQRERACMPYTPAHISFGRGQSIQIDDHFAAVLDATDASTTIGIKYTK